jgi:hypothetical protein
VFSKYLPYTKIYIFALLLLVIGLSTGKFLMSISSLILAGTWLFEGDYLVKWQRIKALNYAPLILAAGFLVHVIWLFNTVNYDYAFHDIVRKLPLLSFPIVIGSMPLLSKRIYELIIGVFIAGLLVSTLLSFGAYLEFFAIKEDIADVRNISFFISHIRLSLLICLAIVLLNYYFFNKGKAFQIVSVSVSFWFCCFLYILSGTGLIVLSLIFTYSVIWVVIAQSSIKAKLLSGLVGFGFLVFVILYVLTSYNDYSQIKDNVAFHSLETHTSAGGLYINDTTSLVTENGYYLWLYVCPSEVEKIWNTKSDYHFDSIDKKGQPISATIYRYITSKGDRKDEQGTLELTDEEVSDIEAGITSCVKLHGIKKRLHQIFFEFENKESGFSSNGHSITQRLNFSYTGILIAKENLLLGVGTGDVPDAFDAKYVELNSRLAPENRKRAHNQFLTLFIAFGIIGFLIWIISFTYPILKIAKDRYVYGAFLVISLISFLGDDTLETQAGVTLFAFFNSFFLFHSLHKAGR